MHFGVGEISSLGCFIGNRGLRVGPAKPNSIVNWTIHKNKKDLHNWLGLANYLHKYSENYAATARTLIDLLKRDADWLWDNTHADAIRATKESLLHAPILALPNPEYPFSVVCGASNFVIGSSLLQMDAAGRKRIIAPE